MNLSNIAQSIPSDKLIIIIARLGKLDLRTNLNSRRLHNIQTYLMNVPPEGFRRSPKTLILAQGERAGKYGQIEFYVDGKLILALTAFPNQDLRVVECYTGTPDGYPFCGTAIEKLFHPCLDFIRTPRKKRVIPSRSSGPPGKVSFMRFGKPMVVGRRRNHQRQDSQFTVIDL